MSEYIEIESEFTTRPDTILIQTNLRLSSEGDEWYESPAAMEEGSPLAQTLATIEGLAALTIIGSELLVTFRPETEWHTLVADISAAIRDFYL